MQKIILGNFLEQILKYTLLIIFLFLLLFLNVNFEIFHLILLYCVVNIIIFFISAYFVYNKDNFFSEKNNLNIKYKEHLKYIYSTGLISLVTVLNTKIDILLIKYFLDEIQVSIYGIGAQLSFIMNIPLIVILHILMPKIASLIRRKKQMQLNILSDFYRFILVIVCVLIIVALSFFYNDIIKIFFNKNYLESYHVFVIIALSYLITSFFSLNDLFFIYSGKETKILIFMFLSFLVNIFLSLILIRDYGIVGSAVALSLSNILFSFLIFISNIKNNYLFKYVFRMIFKNKLWLIKKL
jgi:O-antigen/teichoic acid export membrane protein